jgi:predicted branched-subunit amino acid permease
MMTLNEYKNGLKDGMPIVFGYIPVGFAFGVTAAVFPLGSLS